MNGEQLRAWAEEELEESQYTKPTLVVYDYALILEVLSKGGMPEEDVVEYVGFNILGAWVGESTPFIMRTPE